ncbi:NADH-quinone oxidoreductase subunit J family protein [Thermaerobacter litoralis]
MSGTAVIFAVLAAVVLLGAWRVVTSEQIAHSALFLGLTFVGMAGLFILLQAPTFALLHVLVYVGAILTVVVFAIMLSDPEDLRGVGDLPPGERLRRRLLSPYYGWVPVVVAALLVAVVLAGLAAAQLPRVPLGEPVADDLRAIGGEMFTRYAIPFEVASAALLAALIGAIGLTRREPGEERGRAARDGAAGAAPVTPPGRVAAAGEATPAAPAGAGAGGQARAVAGSSGAAGAAGEVGR